MLSTRFTELVGGSIPLQQSPMGGVTTVELAAAVASAGGMGMLPAQMMPPAVLEGMIAELREKTDGAFGVTFLVPRFGVPCPNRATSGAIDAMALYAGQSVGAVECVQPAAEIVEALASGAEGLLTSPY